MIEDDSYSKRKKIFLSLGFSLAILNFSDGLFTYIGLYLGLVEEANPVLAWMEPLTILIIKTVLTFALIWLLLNPKYIPYKRIVYYFFFVANGLFLFVNGWHLFWMYLAFIK